LPLDKKPAKANPSTESGKKNYTKGNTDTTRLSPP
jgi:hypothetical protein